MTKSILPVTLVLSLITTVLLVMMCFLGATFYHSNEALKDAEKKLNYVTDYYEAETIAAENLSSQHDGSVFFSIPINAKKELEVAAQVSQGKIDVLRWNTERR